jgi:hypothetical protein
MTKSAQVRRLEELVSTLEANISDATALIASHSRAVAYQSARLDKAYAELKETRDALSKLGA